MKSRVAAFAVAACLALAGCFTSEAPLFSGAGAPLLGRGLVTITTYEAGETPETGQMQWTAGGYVDPGDEEDEGGATTFHRLPGSGVFSSWYVGQTGASDNDGYVYALYRIQGERLNTYDLGCKDLSSAEAVAAHLVRSESGSECKATRAGDLAQAFRLLSKRKPSNGYMTAKPAR